jgi:hypothetical protein
MVFIYLGMVRSTGLVKVVFSLYLLILLFPTDFYCIMPIAVIVLIWFAIGGAIGLGTGIGVGVGIGKGKWVFDDIVWPESGPKSDALVRLLKMDETAMNSYFKALPPNLKTRAVQELEISSL